MSSRLTVVGLFLSLLVLCATPRVLATTPLLQVDMVAADDSIFIYQDLSPWYALGEVITVVRGPEVVGRVKVETIGRTISRLSLFERMPGKKPRPGDRLVGQEMPPKGLPIFTGTRTGFEVGVAIEDMVIVYENLSAYYPIGAVFRVVEGSVTIGQARVFAYTNQTTSLKADLAPGLEVRAGMRLYPMEEPVPVHALLAPERDFLGKGQTLEDELGMGPMGMTVPKSPQPTKSLSIEEKGSTEIVSSTTDETKAPVEGGAECPAKVDSLAGTAEVKLVGGEWKKPEIGLCLFGDDMVKTGQDSGLALALSDGSTVKVAQLTQATLQGARRKDEAKREVTGAEMTEGELWAEVASDKGAFAVTTPTGVVNVRGTEFSVRVDKDDKGETQLQVFTLEGEVELADKEGKVIALPKGKAGKVLGKVLSAAFDFDVASFKDYLGSWKDLLTPGGVRDFIKAKLFSEIQGKLNDALNKVIPGGGDLAPDIKVPGGGGLGF